jgi:hypothetical protein
MKILKVVKSDRKGKKLKAILDNGSEVHFGSDVSQSFVEGATKQTRDNYLKRHLANPIEKRLIENNVISPSLLSAALLWNTPSLQENIKILNKKLS